MCDLNENPLKLSVKWNGKEYEIPEFSPSDSVAMLKIAIENATGVRPERQKLLNIMMMGSLEEAILGAQVKPEVEDVINDLDIEDEELDVKVLNEPREGKKLLVLDIDYTLFDHRSVAETGYELMRPYLHEFLTSAYEDYDIVIWSATGMKWIEEKMRLLGVSSHQDYKIWCYLDYLAMITIHTPKYGTIDYSSKNTIMFDDIRRNFLMNPRSGLKIRAFRQAHLNRDKDRELIHLSAYLKDIAQYCDDFDTLNHKKWEKYRPDKKTQHAGSKRKAEDSAPTTPKE
ncbi:Ubiquitin-like domain-containing CTD phosphatase 1 [Operophtera brumata]|uniref:Ubiquitin-like domain-containing CTD phosphatase 1 n=1 Tax=Operophtera brumata TaxID=104452 RepID=A0A0L7KTN3_OPEBR|nr:Ubiquitin-like domain-containing CTD phosphatase 1 [Operophtera brumata]